jgi:hypothetical protein
MAIVKTYIVKFDASGNIINTKEIDVDDGLERVVIVHAKNPTNANKAALALRGE